MWLPFKNNPFITLCKFHNLSKWCQKPHPLSQPPGHRYILDPILHSGTHLQDPTPSSDSPSTIVWSTVPPIAAYTEALALLCAPEHASIRFHFFNIMVNIQSTKIDMFPQIIIVGPTVPYVYVFIEKYLLSFYTSEVANAIRQNCLVHKNGQLKGLVRLNHSLTRPKHSFKD